MIKNKTAQALLTAMFMMSVIPVTHAKEPEFKSELFKKGTLVYSDDFDGELNINYWGKPGKIAVIKDGVLTFSPKFKSKEEAMKKLKRDHHLGLGVVAHMKKIPEKFVLHMRYKFVTDAIVPGRPSFQIGHHMMNLSYLKGGGHRLGLSGGPGFNHPESGMKINEWVDLVIEYEKGRMLLSINGVKKIYEHENVTMDNTKDKHGPRFSFKSHEGIDERIVFDYVRLWKVD